MNTIIIFGAVSVAAFILGGGGRLVGGRGAACLFGAILALCILAGWSIRFGWPPVPSGKISEAFPWMMLAALVAGTVLDRWSTSVWTESFVITLLGIGAGVMIWISFSVSGFLWQRSIVTAATACGGLVVLWRLQRMSERPSVTMISLLAASGGLYGVAVLTGQTSVSDPALFMCAGLSGVLPWTIYQRGRLSPALFLTAGCTWLMLSGSILKSGGLWPVVILLTVFFAENAFISKASSLRSDSSITMRSLWALTAACILSIFVALLVAYVGSAMPK